MNEKYQTNNPGDEQPVATCPWCGSPFGACGCGYKKLTLDKLDPTFWDRVEEIFGESLPSCGLTDALRLGGSVEDQTPTLYLHENHNKI